MAKEFHFSSKELLPVWGFDNIEAFTNWRERRKNIEIQCVKETDMLKKKSFSPPALPKKKKKK